MNRADDIVSFVSCWALAAIFAVGLVRLGVKLREFQVEDAADYRGEASRQSERRVRTPGMRGRILDRHGHVLAESRLASSLVCDPARFQRRSYGRTAEAMGEAIAALGRDLGRTDGPTTNALARHVYQRRSIPLVVWRGLSERELAAFAERESDYPGFAVDTEEVRSYPFGPLAAQLLGYVGRDRDGDGAADGEKFHFFQPELRGRAGLETYYDSYLRGVPGVDALTVDANGYAIRTESVEEPQKGLDLRLALDAELQRVAERELAGRAGACVALDPRTGDVLVFASAPGYDPNDFVPTLDPALYRRLADDPAEPLLNRASGGAYAPGSTFKPVTAVAGLQSGVIDGTTYINDDGIYTYYADYQPKCWYYTAYGRGHGQENVVGALEDSCNYFFYETGRRLGGKKLEKYAKKFGLGDYTGIELSGEKTGTVAGPTERAEAVKNGTGREWSGGDVLQSAIGQGDNNYTPIQLANYCVAIANGGTVHSAHLLKAVMNYNGTKTVEKNNPGDLSRVKASDETWSLVREGMAKVTGEDGTAASVFENYSMKVAGKSGTAQRYGKQDNGLFISFAPYDDPEIAVCVVIEGGDSGNNVAPVVRDIYDYYFYGSQASTEEDGEESTADSTQETDDDEQSSTADTVRDWLNGLISG